MSYVRPALAGHWNSIDTINSGLAVPQISPDVIVWPTANLAIYLPVIVRTGVVVRKLWYANLDTSTGNYDIGLYTSAGVALARKGSTAKGTDILPVVWDCSDVTIGPGSYYLAFAESNNTDSMIGYTLAAPLPATYGVLSEAVFPLPATATFAIPQTLTVVPVVGMLLDTRWA
jgi:hypothetical protein